MRFVRSLYDKPKGAATIDHERLKLNQSQALRCQYSPKTGAQVIQAIQICREVWRPGEEIKSYPVSITRLPRTR